MIMKEEALYPDSVSWEVGVSKYFSITVDVSFSHQLVKPVTLTLWSDSAFTCHLHLETV